jgi:hypothetical protein
MRKAINSSLSFLKITLVFLKATAFLKNISAILKIPRAVMLTSHGKSFSFPDHGLHGFNGFL